MLSSIALLRDHLGPSIAKALATAVFQVPVISNPLIDFLKSKLKTEDEARQAERQIGRLADQCLSPLLQMFASAKDSNPEAVAITLGETVEQHVDVRALVADDLDRARVHKTVMAKRPLSDLRAKVFATADIELYRRALPPLLDRMIDIAPKLEGFEGASTAETLARLRAIIDDVGQMKSGLAWIEHWMKHEDQRWRDYASTYSDYIDDKLNVIQLFGLTGDGTVKQQRLSTAFIPLTLTHDADADQNLGSGYFETALNRLSKESPRLLITGPAGSGKTTLMRWAAIEAAGVLLDPERAVGSLKKKEQHAARGGVAGKEHAGEGFERGSLSYYIDKGVSFLKDHGAAADILTSAWQFRIPFLIPLRYCKEGKLPPLQEFTAIGTRFKRTPPDGWVEAVIEAGCALILIDGIDEVAHGDRNEIREELASLCQSFAGNYLVFTTRPGVIDDDWFADLDMMRAEVNPLTEHERTALIDHWHEAAAEKIGSEEARTIAAALVEKLRQSPAIAQLGTSPLLAAAICALHYARDGYLPKKQADLCKQLCSLLIHHRDLERKIADLQDDTTFGLLDYDHKERLVQAMAQVMLRGGEPTLAPEIAEGLIEDELPGFGLSTDLNPAFVRERLVERAGVLREAYGGGIDFAHNTLRDFLAGQAFAAERGGAAELAKNASDEAWQRPIVFAAGAGTQDFAASLVRALANRGSRIAKILAILCDATVTTLDPALRKRVLALQDDVFPPKTMEEAALLATLSDPIVDRLTKRGRSKAVHLACLRALRLIGTEKAEGALRTYWQTDQQDLAEELAQIFNPLAVPFWQNWTKREQTFPESVLPRIADLAPLRGLSGLQRLFLDNTQVADLAPLRGLSGLQELYLNNTQVADLAPLRGLSGLQRLLLDNTQVADLAPLRGLSGLQRLLLDNTQVADLAPLRGLSGLQRLDLDNTQVADLAPLRGLSGLQELYLNNTQVADLAPLRGLSGLQTLFLDNTQVADLAPLRGLSGLQTLFLDNTQVTDLAPLRGLSGLQTLLLDNTQVADLAPLRGLSGLQELYLNNTQVADLAPLRGLSGLQRLFLDNTQVADVSVLDHIQDLEIMR